MLRLRLLACFVLACMFSIVGYGQVQTGTPAFGTFSSNGPDAINIGNLNVLWNIPVLSKPQRGGQAFTYNLAYNSSVWYPVTSGSSTSWQPVDQWGWSGLSLSGPTYVTYTATNNIINCAYNGTPLNYTYWHFLWIEYVDSMGIQHSFPTQQALGYYDSPYAGQGSCPQSGPTQASPTVITASDNSGLTASVIALSGSMAGSLQITITTPSGKVLSPPSVSTPPPTSSVNWSTDSNGNQINVLNGQYTDTTGNVALSIAGEAPSNTVLSYTTAPGSSSTSASYTVSYKTYNVQTAFGCPGISEYGSHALSLVDRVTLPDASFYQFSYEPTPGVAGHVTGRVAGVTLPSLGTVSYAYTGSNNGIVCADGSAAGLRRATVATSTAAASTWTYTRTPGAGTSQTNVVDGLNNALNYSFVAAGNQAAGITAAYYETQRSIYNGSATGTPVLSRATCYNAAKVPCTTTAFSFPVSQLDTYETLDGVQQHGYTLTYNSSGLVSSEKDYDYAPGNSARGPLLRQELWTYAPNTSTDLVASDTVEDGKGNVASLTTYKYDETTPVATSGLPEHVAAGGPGNLTTVTQYTAATTSLVTKATYEDTGNVLTVTSPNGQASYAYDSATHVYLQTATPPTPLSGVSLPNSATYDAASGAATSITDPNGNSVKYKSFDPFLRPAEIDNPDGGKALFTYTPTQITEQVYQSASVYATVGKLFDAYGRPSRSALANGQGTNPYYQQDTCYDANGNGSFVSYGYQSTGFGTAPVCSGSGDTYSHDVLGRLTKILHADASKTSVTYNYTGRTRRLIDENGVARLSQFDGLGRTTNVCEISSNSSMPNSGSPVACGMDIAATGFLTNYAYNLSAHQTTVTQGAQTRNFINDWLERPISLQEPEASAPTTYAYVYNSTGLLITRTRPTANQANASVTTTTQTQYDSLGRPVSVQYKDGTAPSSTTVPKYFVWDVPASWVESSEQTNLKGRLSNPWRPAASGAPSGSGTIFGYDSMGRVIAQTNCMPTGCGNASADHTINYTYNLAGMLTSEGDGNPGDTYTYGRSYAGEITSITSAFSDAKNPANIISAQNNQVFGPASVSYGNGLAAAYSYDPLGRINGGWLCGGSSQTNCTGGTSIYNYSLSSVGTQVKSLQDSVLGQSSTFGYDEFNRLTSKTVAGNASANLGWTYDRYGNRWAQNGSPAPSYSFTAANNHSTFAYDALGNVTYDGFHHYTYDADNNVISVDGGSTATYTYDALNQRIGVNAQRGNFEHVFDVMGRRASTWMAGSHVLAQALIYSDSGPVAYRTAGSTHFAHQDYLGTRRMVTSYNGAVENTFTSLPYGDAYTQSATDNDWYHFAGQDSDIEDNTQHAQYRQYSSISGHWMSPDPYLGSYDMNNPQSMNRYTYALNNPLSFVDPSGLSVQVCDSDGNCYTYSDDQWNNAMGGGLGDGFSIDGDGNIICPDGSTCGSVQYIDTSGFSVGVTISPEGQLTLIAPDKRTPPAQPQGNSWSHPLTPPTCQQWKNWGKADAFVAGGAAYLLKQAPITAPVTGPIAAVFGGSALIENGVAIAQGCFF